MRLTRPKSSSLLDGQLAKKDYLQINAFLDLVVVEQEENPHILQKKLLKEPQPSNKINSWLDAAKPDSWDFNISFYPRLLINDGGKVALQYMACDNIAVLESLDVTLDNPADLRK